MIHRLDVIWKANLWMIIGDPQMGSENLLSSVTCVRGRGRPRAEGLVAGRPTLLLSSSNARVSCSNCTSCSLTDSSRAAALSHCSIHTILPQLERGALHTSLFTRLRKISCFQHFIGCFHQINLLYVWQTLFHHSSSDCFLKIYQHQRCCTTEDDCIWP